jgi:hypothetical protein
MRDKRIPLLLRFGKDEGGQTAVLVTVMIFALMALAAAGIETGHVYYAYRLLQASTNAAALAAGQAMPDIGTQSAATAGTAWGNLIAYSSETGQHNATNLLKNVSITANFYCSSKAESSLNLACGNPPSGEGSCSSGSTGCNAVTITQNAQVGLWFGGFVGFNTFNLTATASAAMRGGTGQAWNIAVILDTTKSMSDPDSGAQCSGTQISCAIQGVQYLLADLTPCPLNMTCGAKGVSYVDDVSLYVFPPVLATTAPLDYCSGGSGAPTHEYYMVPTLNPLWTYQIVPYSDDYRTSDSTSSLNSSSDIAIATGATKSCSGIQAPGGAGTYYAQVIYQAQSDLVAQQTANPGSKNAMIILSDGNATATNSSGDIIPSVLGLLNGILGVNPNSYTYPSAVGECGQAVVAAQAAANAGTAVYTIGYGAETSGGCTSDKTYSASVTTGGGTWGPGDQPCQAMAAMASSTTNFFSDDAQGCAATSPSNQSLTKLTSIFQAVSNSFTSSRLIPTGS